MDITLCKTTDDNRRVLKHYTNERTVSMNPVSSTNILSPTFTVDYDQSLLSYNYAHITFDNIKRFYFVSPPTLVKGGRLMFKFSVDALMTAGLLNCEGVIVRNEKIKTREFEDSMYPIVYGRQGDFENIELPVVNESGLPSWVSDYLWFGYMLTR